MILYDINKIQELKKTIEEKPEKEVKLQKKIAKIESRYRKLIAEHDDLVEAFYTDKKGKNTVAVMKDNGIVLQIRGKIGSSLNPKFIGFMFAYFILLLISVPIMFMGAFKPELESFADALSIVTSVLALVLNVLTVVCCFDVMKKHKSLWLLVLFAFVLNIIGLTDDFIQYVL